MLLFNCSDGLLPLVYGLSVDNFCIFSCRDLAVILRISSKL